MKQIRKNLTRKMAALGIRGLGLALERMRELGWCREVKHAPDSMLVEWAPETEAFLRACACEGEKQGEAARHVMVVRFTLLLDLLAAGASPVFSVSLVNTRPGEQWALVLLSELGRGRYRPGWWDAGLEWHANLRQGLVSMPVFFPWVIQDGLFRTARRLAELGWLAFEEYHAPGYQCYVPGPWQKDVEPFVGMLAAYAAHEELPAGIDSLLATVGRLSLLLHLRLMKVPAELLTRIMAEGVDTDIWAVSLAHRVTRGLVPLWWNRNASWHAAVRKSIREGIRKAGFLPGLGEQGRDLLF